MTETYGDLVGRAGMLTAFLVTDRPDLVTVEGDEVQHVDMGDGRTGILVRHHNAYVNTGLTNSLQREFGTGGTAVGYIGVSSSTSAVTATTTFLNGASAGAAANTIIKAISPTASLSGQTMTAGATFANADFTSGVFAITKVGLLTTSTDAGTGLVDVVGGSGTTPYNKPFTVDFSALATAGGTVSLTFQIAVTAVAV